jgi:hypothetical protein
MIHAIILDYFEKFFYGWFVFKDQIKPENQFFRKF